MESLDPRIVIGVLVALAVVVIAFVLTQKRRSDELHTKFVQYQLHVRLVNAEHRATVRSALNSNILDSFNAANVQIMTPHFEGQPDKPVLAALQ